MSCFYPSSAVRLEMIRALISMESSATSWLEHREKRVRVRDDRKKGHNIIDSNKKST